MSDIQKMIDMLRYPEQNNGVYIGDLNADIIEVLEQHREDDDKDVEIDELGSKVKQLEDDLEEAQDTINDLEAENEKLQGDNDA